MPSKHILQHLPVGFILYFKIPFNIDISHFHGFIYMVKGCMDCIFVNTYFRAKTSARRNDKAKMKVKVMEVIKPLVEKYRDRTGKRVFNFYQHYSTADAFNKAINYGLKQIGGILQIEDLEYYAARHSWAT